MERYAIILRHPIIKRIPVINRVAIFNRQPCCSGVPWEQCKLCHELEDCSGNKFLSVNDMKSPDIMRVIYIPDNFENWENLEQTIWDCNSQGILIRLITDVELPKEIIWALSHSDKNILQVNVNMLRYKEKIDSVSNMISIANRCGVYCVLCLHPITPYIVKSYQVIEVIDQIMNQGCFHVNLKFCEITREVIEGDGYINFNSHLLPVKHMNLSQFTWKCSSDFINEFLDKIHIFTIPRKISVSVCGEADNCIGIKLGG